MHKNVGNSDKVIRFVVASVFIVLYATGIVEGTLGILALVVAGVLVSTGLINFCPLYPIFGINTCKIKSL
jgi:hypothetical protein